MYMYHYARKCGSRNKSSIIKNQQEIHGHMYVFEVSRCPSCIYKVFLSSIFTCKLVWTVCPLQKYAPLLGAEFLQRLCVCLYHYSFYQCSKLYAVKAQFSIIMTRDTALCSVSMQCLNRLDFYLSISYIDATLSEVSYCEMLHSISVRCSNRPDFYLNVIS